MSQDSSPPDPSHASPSTIPSNLSRSSSSREPRSNPHAYLIQRTTADCRSNLSDSQRTRWNKASTKAKHNAELIRQYPLFQYPDVHYGEPIFIHCLTQESVFHSLLEQLRDVTVYVIDTESDAPTQFQPQPSPALLQVLAIHHERSFTILLIETHFIPYPSSPTFHLLKQLCELIFSSTHHIVTWGDTVRELSSFEQYSLFDLTHIEKSLNLQLYFTNHWNDTHPHTSQCPVQSKPIYIISDTDSDVDSDVDLICQVNSSDINALLFPKSSIKSKSIQCTCPDTLRPYKQDTEQWALQKAIKFVFQEALDKLHTMNVWSCGLDPRLSVNSSPNSITTRANMTTYAVNDVLAPTRLLFHLNHEIIRVFSLSTSSTITSTTTIEQQQQSTEPSSSTTSQSTLPSYFIFSDSHAKYLDSTILTAQYQLNIRAISGLKWQDDYDKNLCAHTWIFSQSLSSHLADSAAVLFLIGINSLRCADAAIVLQHVAYIIDHIHQRYSHLKRKRNITIVKVFPCFKTSSSFPSSSSLSSNIAIYNQELENLSNSLNFTVIDLNINAIHLANDQLHVRADHRYLILESITTHFDDLTRRLSSHSSSKHSIQYKRKRNKVNHSKLKIKRQQFIIQRPVSAQWKPKHIKQVFSDYNLRRARILEVRNHLLTIQFNNSDERDATKVILPDDIFDSKHFQDYFPE